MKKYFLILCMVSILTVAFVAEAGAKIRVVTTYPYIKDLVKTIGRGEVRVNELAVGNWNPHYVVPRPSYIAKLRRADLLVINGAQIELGWLPPLLNDSANPGIKPGNRGFLDLSTAVKLIDVPSSISRAQGDVHPAGNPHFYLDPSNIPLIARAIMNKLCELRPGMAGYFRSNYEGFVQNWDNRRKDWEARMKPLKGTMVVQYHKQFDYFFKHFGIRMEGTLEPLPGIPPTSRHMEIIIALIKNKNIPRIIQDVFNSSKPAYFVADRTKARVIVLPHDVNAVSGVNDVYSLFEEIVRRLTND